ncbi:hypothetical protein FE257_012544 [Aspergillus nanangensis]|uniref:1,3-beta-glucanosyltransferase n=1 Tax=Aspergillus nanangensis TaxID=2582783 RepID=A0AAD4CWL7_ASPNN|nr:hypothetical protein FE257_012544 [Aspergillus nanangensis]
MISLSPTFPTISLLLGGLHALTATAVPTISVVGSKFFYEDGRQYFLKGIAYQRTPEDPLIDTAQCERDVARMAELGTNAIRVYHVDPAADHDGCMTALADAGIYLFVDVDTFDTSIRQDDPSWTQSQFDSYKAVLDTFQKYDNTAGFLVGNEVLSTAEGSPAAPYVLAAARDMKSYRNEKKYRNIPIGYTAADIAELRPMLQNYLACRTDPAERLDFFGLNAYEWCGSSSFKTSGYSLLQDQAKDYPIPIFFSETGCNAARPRTFDDQAAIFGPEMSDTWSGSIIYEWIEETNNYGLINYGPRQPDAPPTNTLIQDGFPREGTPTSIAPDFDNLKAQWATLTPSGVALSDYVKSASTVSPAACPASTAGGWVVDPNAPLPTLGQTFHRIAPEPPTVNSGSGSNPDINAVHGSNAQRTASPTGGANSVPTPSLSPTSSSLTYDPSNSAHSISAPKLDRAGDTFLFLCVITGALAVWL